MQDYLNSALFRQGPRETRQFYLWRYAVMCFVAPEVFFPLRAVIWELRTGSSRGGRPRKGEEPRTPLPNIDAIGLLRINNLYVHDDEKDTEYTFATALMRDGPLGQVAAIDNAFMQLLTDASTFAQGRCNKLANIMKQGVEFHEEFYNMELSISNKLYKLPTPASLDPNSPFVTFVECMTKYYERRNDPAVLLELGRLVAARNITVDDLTHQFEFVSACVDSVNDIVAANHPRHSAYMTHAAA